MFRFKIPSGFIFVVGIILTFALSGCSKTGRDPVSPNASGIHTENNTLPSRQYETDIDSNPVNLIVLLNSTPEDLYTRASEDGDNAFPEIATLAEQIKDIYRENREDIFAPTVMSQVAPLVNQMTELKSERAAYVRAILESSLGDILENGKNEIETIPNTLVISTDLILNSLVVGTYVQYIEPIRELPCVLDVVEDMQLIPLMDTTAQAQQLRPGAYPQAVWNYGFHGEGVKVIVMDTGVKTDHSAFQGLNLVSEYFPTNASGCTYEDTSNHGTHNAGVIGSQDEIYKGLAYGIDTLYNAKMCNGYDGFQQIQDAYNWAALGGSGHNDAQVINFSMVFSFDCANRSGIDMISEYVDNTVDLYDMIWSVGAGNRSAGCDDDQINDKPAVSYNTVAVAGVTDADTGLRDDDSYYADSKYGPVTGPGGSGTRMKPDIMALTQATSPEAGGGFSPLGGTSCATPHYTAVAAVLFSAGVGSALEMRALTLATAGDYTASPGDIGVDAYTGYGYVNAWDAYEHIPDIYTGEFTDNGDHESFKIMNCQPGDKVVLVYNKHKSGTSYKLSDLDLRVYDASNGNILYETSNQYENKEWIDFGPEYAGKDLIIAVIAKNIPPGLAKEKWAIAANTVMVEYVEPPAQAPTLIAPVSGYNYILGDDIYFSWEPAAGTTPTAYWVDVWRNGEHFQLLPLGGINIGSGAVFMIGSEFVEKKADDGLWEWSVASVINSQKYWSEKNYIQKFTAPDLISPLHNEVVESGEVFDWADEPGALNYVAKVTGILPGDQPYYLPLNNTNSQFVLAPGLYDWLDEDKVYTWAVAGTALGAWLPASEQATLGMLSYTIPWNFEK